MVTALLPGATRLSLEQVIASTEDLTLALKMTAPLARCPVCGYLSSRVHSHYRRTLADLPWQGVVVRLQLHTRRFFCDRTHCRRRIFTERLPDLVAPYARRTQRLRAAQELLGLALGGEAGARILKRLGMGISPDTVLNLIRQVPMSGHPTPRVLGIDDWAWRKGQKYGTILCDLERAHPVDLLPDRTADPVAAWLKAHPGVEIISRDRSGAYADGARQGAPNAIQIADRWHVLKNMTEALQRLLDRKQKYLRQAAEVLLPSTPPASSDTNPAPAATPAEASAPASPRTRKEQDRQVRRARRLDRYTEVKTLYQQEVSIHKIAERLRMGRRTVRRLVRSETFPERHRPRPRRRKIDPFLPYVKQRWDEGCHNGMQLWREISAQGFRGSRAIVGDIVARWRAAGPPGPANPVTGTPIAVTPSARRSAWMLLRRAEERRPEEQAYCARLSELCPDIDIAATRAREFLQIITGRKADQLALWMDTAAESGVLELRTFVSGLRRDEAAVKAALTYPWSNGPVEGEINRLKLIKRQMYGRANFDLLRQRVLNAV